MKGRGMKLSHYLIGLLLLLVFLSISIGTSDFSWGKLFALDHETWLLFQESRLPRTISILLAASSMSMAGLLMQTITQNQFAAPSTVGTTEAAKLGMVLSLFVFPSASLTQKMLFAFGSDSQTERQRGLAPFPVWRLQSFQLCLVQQTDFE